MALRKSKKTHLVEPSWGESDGGGPPLTELTSAHVLHRWVAIVVGVIVVGTALVAWRTQRAFSTYLFHPVFAKPRPDRQPRLW